METESSTFPSIPTATLRCLSMAIDNVAMLSCLSSDVDDKRSLQFHSGQHKLSLHQYLLNCRSERRRLNSTAVHGFRNSSRSFTHRQLRMQRRKTTLA
ncbi:hypothetical protein Trydic_g13736 [Trypoxylus dichotomus]